MKLAIFGATGRTGRILAERALEQGHAVTALARNPAALDPRVRAIKGDALDETAVAEVVAGQDAVLSCLGAPGLFAKSTICSDAAACIVPAMERAGVKRLVVLGTGLVARAPLPARLLAKHIIADKTREEKILEGSGLDYVVVRAPRLTNGRRTGSARISRDGRPPGFTVSRADVADVMLQAVSDSKLRRIAIGVAG